MKGKNKPLVLKDPLAGLKSRTDYPKRAVHSQIKDGCACTSGMSTDIRKAYDIAYGLFNGLSAMDKCFQRWVKLHGEDGLEMTIPNAFFITDEVVCGTGKKKHSHLFVMVITEHYGVMVFSEDDLETYTQAVPPAFKSKFEKSLEAVYEATKKRKK